MAKGSETRLLVVFSDLHVGSTQGLLHPEFETHEGVLIHQNELQKWLWKAWEDCWEWASAVIGKDEFAIVVNGDVVEGIHHRSKEVWSVDEGDHLDACVEILLDKAKKAKSFYVTEGTEVHTKSAEHALARILKSKGANVVSPSARRGAWDSLRMRCAGTLCEIDHHMQTTIRSYLEASALSITLGDIRNQRARAGEDPPKVIVRSHRHRFGLYEDGYGMMVSLPPWQGLTRFGRKVVTGAAPQVGLVILDWRTTETNTTPVVHKRLHTIKQALPPVV